MLLSNFLLLRECFRNRDKELYCCMEVVRSGSVFLCMKGSLGVCPLGRRICFASYCPALISIGNKLIEFAQAESIMVVFSECFFLVLISTHELFAVFLYPCPVVEGSVALGAAAITPLVPDSGSCQVCRALSAL